jgi:hypothetical protein
MLNNGFIFSAERQMNWTSTKVPLWQLDCQNYWRAGSPFEIRDVTTDEDRQFIETFAVSHNLSFTRRGDSVVFQAAHFHNNI